VLCEEEAATEDGPERAMHTSGGGLGSSNISGDVGSSVVGHAGVEVTVV